VIGRPTAAVVAEVEVLDKWAEELEVVEVVEGVEAIADELEAGALVGAVVDGGVVLALVLIAEVEEVAGGETGVKTTPPFPSEVDDWGDSVMGSALMSVDVPMVMAVMPQLTMSWHV
jgi:hypothetical protein